VGEPDVPEGITAEEIPFWSTIWESALALTQWIAAERDWSGRSVLEIGCGTGVVGLAAALCGADVLQTDGSPAAVALARCNAAENGLENVRSAVADWRTWPFRRRWPVLLASDVAYERVVHPALLGVLNAALASGGAAYFADPARRMSLDFFALAARSGWSVTRMPLPSDGLPVFLYILRRSAATFG
jgi:predicted nicotinamide N-methyase